MIEGLLKGVVRGVTGGRYVAEKNPEFDCEMREIKKGKRSLSTRIYDSGTLLIIDDITHTFVPKFILRKNRG